MNRINILKTVGGYRVFLETTTTKNNFFVVENEELIRIKELEKMCLEHIKLKSKAKVIKNITNIDIVEFDEAKRINISVDTISLEGMLLESNHRYSMNVEDDLVLMVANIEEMVNEKVDIITSIDTTKLRALLVE